MQAEQDIRCVELSAQDQRSIQVRPLEHLNFPTSRPEPPHRHNFQELIWIGRGRGRHAIDDQILELVPHTCYFVARGQVHQFLRADGVDGCVIGFTDDFLPDTRTSGSRLLMLALFNNLTAVRAIPLRGADAADIEALVGQIRQEFDAPHGFGNEEALGHLVQILLIRLLRTLTRRGGDTVPEASRASVFRAFITLLEQRFRTVHAVTEYAASLSVSPRQLSEATKRHLGKPAKQVIEERLILEAKRDLRFTDRSVKEIAYALGFDDPAHFSKTFKRLARTSPRRYRAGL